MNDKKKMLEGKLYIASADPALREDNKRCKRLLRAFNATTEEEIEQRTAILKSLFAETGDSLYIEPPFHCDYGCHIHVGENLYANYDLIILDVCDVYIGNNVFLAPRVGIYAAGHPIDKDVRNMQLEFGKPIHIGNDVWIGADVTINPGVSIGDNVVIGSGSVVVKDIPSGVVAAGNPCRVIREISEQDAIYWNNLKKEYFSDN